MAAIPDLTSLALKCVVKNPHSAFASSAIPLDARRAALRRRLIRGLSLALAWVDTLVPAAFFHGCGLRVLSFAGCSKISPAFLLSACPPELLGLDVSSFFALEDAHVLALLRACPHLRYLNVMDCRKLTDASVGAMVEHGAALRHVDIGGCTSISAAGVARLVEGHPSIRQFVGLGLSGVAGLGPELLAALGARCSRLQRLAVGYYEGPAAPLVDLLRVNSDSLVALECHWSRAATDDVAMALTGASAFGALRLLNMQGAKAISLDGLCAIVRMHPRREGAPMAEWDASDVLEWRTLAGLPQKALQEALASSACAAPAAGAGAGAGAAAAAMEEEEAEEAASALPSLLRKLGPGLAHLCCRFGCSDGAALGHLKDHVSKLMQAGAGAVLLD